MPCKSNVTSLWTWGLSGVIRVPSDHEGEPLVIVLGCIYSTHFYVYVSFLDSVPVAGLVHEF